MSLASDIVKPRGVIVLFFLYFAAAFIVNQPGFHSAMMYDSASLIEDKEKLFAKGLAETLSIVPARPLFMASLYANYTLAGMNPYGFRLCNAAILGAGGAALALLLSLIFSLDCRRGPPTGRWTAAVSAFLGLLFVVHPLQTFVVLYIWQREAILACFFYFSTVAAYVGIRSGRLPSNVTGFVLVGALFLAGLLTKENLVTVPIILVLIELILFRQGRRGLGERALVIAAVTLVPFAVYLFLTWGLHTEDSSISKGVVNRLLVYYELSGITFFQVLLTESRVFFSYLSSILVPFWMPPQLIEAQVVSTSLGNPPITAAAVAGVIVLLSLAVRYHRTRPVEALGILFYVVALVPESILIPQFLFFGYRPILAMAGVLLIVGQALRSLLGACEKKARVYRLCVVGACTFLIGLFAFQTFEQATRWNPLAFWSNAYARLPAQSERVEQTPYWDIVANLARELMHADRSPEAVDVMTKHLAAVPEMARITAALGEEPEKSPTIAATGTEPSPGRVKIPTALLANLGVALKKSGRPQEAARVYAITANDLGMAFQQSGNLAAAMDQYRLAVSLRPDFPEALYNLGNSLREVGDLAQSADYLKRAIDLRPNYVQALQSLGYTLLVSGRFAEGEGTFKRLVDLDPRNVAARNALGVALAAQGDVEQARAQFQAALEIDPGNAEIQKNLDALPKDPVK